MRLRLGLVAAVSLASSYCYSEVIHGTTENAARDLSWVMTNVLPQVSGLTVNSVVYRYTVTKEVADPFTVAVQNLNALGSGYTFRETDDWSGLPGNTISKSRPVADIPSAYWGNGSIATTGIGSVSNPYVIYGYRYDTCAEPTTDANCPNYTPPYTFTPTEPVIYDPLQDVPEQVAQEAPKDDEPKPSEPVVASKRNSQGKRVADSVLLSSANTAQAAAFLAMNNIPQFVNYSYTLNGGVYKDTVKLVDSKLPDNHKWVANTWSQQALHTLLLNSQYNLMKDSP